MGLFRSEQMGFYRLIMPKDYAWEVVNELGELGLIQFISKHEDDVLAVKEFSQNLKRCEEVENQLKFISQEIVRFKKDTIKCEDYNFQLSYYHRMLSNRGKSDKTYFDELESVILDKFNSLSSHTAHYEEFLQRYKYLLEHKNVLIKSKSVMLGNDNFDGKKLEYGIQKDGATKTIDNHLKGVRLNYLAGVVDKEEAQRFKRMAFRITRGNAWIYMTDIIVRMPEPSGEDEERKYKEVIKACFVIVFQGGQNDIIKSKLNKLCDTFNASKFELPEDSQGYNSQIIDLDAQIAETENVIALTRNQIDSLLQMFVEKESTVLTLINAKIFVAKEKVIYENLNMLVHSNQVYYGYCWIPKDFEEKVQTSLNQIQKRNPNIVGVELGELKRDEHAKPPTYFKLNEFTMPFQEIVNTYGIPRYREVNPGYFAIIMFPFLFGVMFGDIGHGGFLLAFGILLVLKNQALKESKNPISILLPGRFLFLIMGMFAFYSGFIYNDFFSLPWNLFGSCYYKQDGELQRLNDCVYPIGLDPKWYIANNELTFFNSLKMKMAVIIGVTQMLFGVFLKGINTIHYGLYVDFFFEFIPQMLFMICTFGYMCFLIIFKWMFPWDSTNLENARSIITVMINMFLGLGSTNNEPLYDQQTQEKVQVKFLLIAVISVPLMLFTKPMFLYWSQKRKQSKNNEMHQNLLEQGQNNEQKVQNNHEEHGFGDIFVHQMIETIEYVLGAVSNTASYLRLWALSLAHGQLAKVFFEKTIGAGIETASFMQIFVGFFIFINVTFAVIMCMDFMECFLHALRLQWVEFQNKFYKADGVIFKPFNFVKTFELMDKQRI